jgi:SAM-dependent methyltransferase
MASMAIGEFLSGFFQSEPAVCRHAWRPRPNERDCSCSFEKCRRCGVVRKLSRCLFHEDWTQEKRAAKGYFESLQNFVDGIPQNTSYALELSTALEAMGAPTFTPGGSVLEIGCGPGRLVPWFMKAGLRFSAVEPDAWATRYLRDAYDVPVTTEPWGAVSVEPRSVDIVAAVHCLEHLPDADEAFAKMVSASRRYILIVVPEGWDIWNPDHLWAFNQDVLRTWGRNMGLRIYGPVQKRVAEPEDTIYVLFERGQD